MDYEAMSDGLRRGYATTATDDGNPTRGSGSFVYGHPEKLIDFAYRSEHEMTVKAKAIIRAFYGRDPRYSYWDGCSGGGREGLLQAYRYPDEFDGIIAGDPADFRRNAWALWLANASFKNQADYIPPSKYPMIHQAVLDACDAIDGLKDGLIDDPTRCHFDPKVLQCAGEDKPSCLTAQQVQTASTILSPATTQAARRSFPAWNPAPSCAGLDWLEDLNLHRSFSTTSSTSFSKIRTGTGEPSTWSATLRWPTKPPRAQLRSMPISSDLPKHGGKLLLYHGWADQQVAPGATVEFYNSVVASTGSRQSGAVVSAMVWVRLFMAPGMAHCGGGEGPNAFDKISALEQWVEHDKAPDQIIASHSVNGKIDRTRPLCPYPQIAAYQGAGSMDDAANFICRPPRPRDK